MVVIYSDQQQLPESRIELFSEFVDDLIYRETEARSENHYSKADRETLQKGLKQLAWQLQSRTGSMEEARTILARADAETIMPLANLEFSAAASLLELTKDNVRFSHQLLQEFFTAQSFGERIFNGLKASDLWLPESWWEPNGWEEAAKLAADYEADPSDFLQWLAAGNPRLAVEIARDQSLLDKKDTLFSSYKVMWQAAITDIENYPHPHERHAISTALAWLDWDNRSGIGLNELGLPDIHWLEVPEGEFIYGEKETQQTLSLAAFEVSQFPVTNRQFQAFVDAGAYDHEQWWEGLKKPDKLPSHNWTENNRPVELIDWYEAVAFCRWLSAETGDEIRLPTEQEWEKVARGTEGHEYPWGDGYTTGSANIDETDRYNLGEKVGEYSLQETSAVGLYPHSESPCQALDMSGNVWEWCLNKHGETEVITPDLSGDGRVVRAALGTTVLSSAVPRFATTGIH
jgi:formylglycine-generating enzyme required for sulfatase activity